jgi:hypothetical protein
MHGLIRAGGRTKSLAALGKRVPNHWNAQLEQDVGRIVSTQLLAASAEVEVRTLRAAEAHAKDLLIANVAHNAGVSWASVQGRLRRGCCRSLLGHLGDNTVHNRIDPLLTLGAKSLQHVLKVRVVAGMVLAKVLVLAMVLVLTTVLAFAAVLVVLVLLALSPGFILRV